ncbi:MAG: hypothetical protein JWQ94_4447 [Tardiphaga sp.]|nr:hypothetical protein [Tardiphaga sp.]
MADLDPESARGQRPGGDRLASVISGPRRGAREVWVEIPSPDGEKAAWCYSDKRAYRPGEVVTLFLSATVDAVSLTISRDPGEDAAVFSSGIRDAQFFAVPDKVYAVGCGWPAFLTWTIPDGLRSGGYLVEIRDETTAQREVIGHHLIFHRRRERTPGALALVASTSTWSAYNDWGGANHYYGTNPEAPRGRATHLSALRPWARGQVWLPRGAPRCVNAIRPRTPGPARYDSIEWAFINGYTRYYALSGWASHERPFLQWAEANDYRFDVFTQDELHDDPALLNDYPCTVFVGHDEYWSREMRDAVDGYVEGGGRVARFAGNFLWQIRLQRDSQLQVAYKYDARRLDPEAGTSRMTSAWEDPQIGHPGATTFGVNALRGIYAAFGGMARRAARGFNVFRPEHWAFAGTGLGYADMFGDEAGIFGYEMDGVEYTFADGLPVPTHTDGAPKGLAILAMGFATLAESGLPEFDNSLMLGDGDAQFRNALLGEPTTESLERHKRGSGMVVHFSRGAGEVFTAGTCEWVNGLIEGDVFTQQITKNVLNRFSNRS